MTDRIPASVRAQGESVPPDDQEGLDVGLRALKGVRERLSVAARWSLQKDRKFTWWIKELAQDISVSVPHLSKEIWIAQLVASTTVATDIPINEDTYARLSAINAYGATLSALVLDPDGTLRFVTSAIVHEDTLRCVPDQFAFAAAMQAADAQIKASPVVKLVRGRLAVSRHPTSGLRQEADELVHIIERAVVPAGQEPSRWGGEEMESALETLQRTSLRATGGASGVTAEFPFLNSTSLLTMETGTKHPQVGAGLHVMLKLPYLAPNESPGLSAVSLNRLEAYGAGQLDVQGAWCVAPTDDACLTFTAFFPNAFCRKGLAASIALKMSRRADWVASINDGRTLEERWASGKAAIWRRYCPPAD